MDKNKIYRLIICVVILGIIVPFAAQFVLPIFKPCARIAGAEIWNQYVSIILGTIATITSIVSLVLGFRSEEEAKDTEIRTRDLLRDIKENVALVLQKQDLMQNRFADYDVTHGINIADKGVQRGMQDECVN